jgi:predicted RNA-binding protein with PUA-like domain
MPAWLMKTEPDVFSIRDLRRMRVSPWDGVRNYQARNFMRAMAVGDLVVIYHSNAEPSGIAGLAEVARTAYPDHTAWDAASPYHDPKDGPAIARWSMVDVRFVAEAKRFLPLDQLRAEPQLADMLLFSRSRLSVQPVEDRHLAWIRSAAGM